MIREKSRSAGKWVTGAVALAAITVFATQEAKAGEYWLGDGTGGTVGTDYYIKPITDTGGGDLVITQGDLKTDPVVGGSPDKALIFDTDTITIGSGAEWKEVPRGGAAAIVMPTAATAITASGLDISGYTTTITHNNMGLGDTNVFGPLLVFGSKYAATANDGTTGTGIDGEDTGGTYTSVTDVTSATFDSINFSNNHTTLKVVATDGSGGLSSGFGGAARFANLSEFRYTGGTITGNTLSVISASVNPADVLGLHANGGAFAIESDFGTDLGHGNDGTQVINLHFSNNGVLVGVDGLSEEPGLNSWARGGAVYVAGYNNLKEQAGTTQDNEGLLFTVKGGSSFANNTATNQGAGSAGGGALFANLGVKSVIDDVTFVNNAAYSNTGRALGGAVALELADQYPGGTGTLEALDTDADSVLQYFADFSDTIFEGNKAESQAGGALGGAIAVTTDYGIRITDTDFVGNAAIVKTGAGTASGGAIHSEGNIIVRDETDFIGNSVQNEDAGAALGGAIYVASGKTLYLDDAIFANNSASAKTGDAKGGAIYYSDNDSMMNTISDSSFTGNSAKDGGAVYVHGGGGFSLIDTSFQNNSASENGGAIHMDTTGAGGFGLVSIDADSKDILIAGNTDKDGANAIYFGGNNAGWLNLRGNKNITLLDGFKANLTGGAFSFSNDNAVGTVTLGGVSTITAAGGAFVSFADKSTNYFDDSFTIKAENGTYLIVNDSYDDTMSGSTTYRINSTRDGNLALFQFEKGAANQFNFLKEQSVIEFNDVIALFPFEQEYLVAKGIETNGDTSIGWYGDGAYLSRKGDDLWLTMKHEGNQVALANASLNFLASGASGVFDDALVKNQLTQDQVNEIARYANAAVPGFAMNMAGVGLSGMNSAQNAALKFGNGRYGVYANGRSYDECGSGNVLDSPYLHRGLRFWAGYIGDFDRLDSDSGASGYKADRHGVISGLNYDFGDAGTVGFFGGYSNTKTTARDIDAEVKTDAGHFGLIGRATPFRELRNFTVSGDVGYTFTNNDSWREMGSLGRASGKFDQDLFTVGTQLDYDINFACNGSLTPFLSGRYSHVRQDAFSETGVMSANLDKFTGSRFTTRLGAALSYDFEFAGGALTPTFSAAWRHDFGDRQFETDAMYNVHNPVCFVQNSAEFARDFAEIGASLRTAFAIGLGRQIGLNAGYNLNMASKQKNHSLYAGFDLSF